MTQRQSNNQWSGGIAAYPVPKYSECKNPLEESSPQFFFFWVLLISVGVTEEHFEGKPPREGHEGCLVLARQCPGSPGTCNPEETGLPWLPMP